MGGRDIFIEGVCCICKEVREEEGEKEEDEEKEELAYIFLFSKLLAYLLFSFV
jgi:hypothetical protein